jgi:hypothetical protein
MKKEKKIFLSSSCCFFSNKMNFEKFVDVLLEHEKDDKRKEMGLLSVFSVFGKENDYMDWIDPGFYHVVGGLTCPNLGIKEDEHYIVYYNGVYGLRRMDKLEIAHGANASIWKEVKKVEADEMMKIILGQE